MNTADEGRQQQLDAASVVNAKSTLLQLLARAGVYTGTRRSSSGWSRRARWPGRTRRSPGPGGARRASGGVVRGRLVRRRPRRHR